MNTHISFRVVDKNANKVEQSNSVTTPYQVKLPILSSLILLTLLLMLISAFNPSWADENSASDLVVTESDRQLLLKSISENAMLPIFNELESSSKHLVSKTKSFCTLKNDESLLELRKAWSETANAWQQADSLLFGPTVDDNMDFTVYFLPIKKANIKTLLRKDMLTKEDVDSAGVGAQGLGVLEYLLFSRELSLAEIKQGFDADPKQCIYLLRATELLNENINSISRQWKHYGVQFGLAGNSSLYFLESAEAMTLLVNKLYQSAQKVSNKKVGLLSNKKKVKKSTSYKLQAWRSGTSLEQAKANVKGIKLILDDGKVLQWFESNDKSSTAKELSQLMDAILEQKVPNNDLFSQLQADPESLQVLVKNSQQLTELIKTQVAPSLGVELGFNDNDGD